MFGAIFWRKVALSFIRAFIPFFFLGLAGVWDDVAAGDWNASKSAIVALIGGAVTAGLRAIQALFTNLEPQKD
jgi:hypothetical protein